MAKPRRRTESASVVDHPTQTPDSTAMPLDSRGRIAMRAYELYLARGGADGGDFDDWLAAEREIAGGRPIPPREDSGE